MTENVGMLYAVFLSNISYIQKRGSLISTDSEWIAKGLVEAGRGLGGFLLGNRRKVLALVVHIPSSFFQERLNPRGVLEIYYV
ncbi:hypothetical protein J6590_054086 [Homalodisca vitripennis]|nr:hypothetical protein J6590_054086 [Homalodisca vitripennis]